MSLTKIDKPLLLDSGLLLLKNYISAIFEYLIIFVITLKRMLNANVSFGIILVIRS